MGYIREDLHMYQNITLQLNHKMDTHKKDMLKKSFQPGTKSKEIIKEASQLSYLL